MLLAALAFAACEDDNGDNPKDTIEITGGSTAQVIYADQTASEDGGGLTFTTSGPWRAEVVDVTESRAANTADWVLLSQTSGDAAGEYTIQITLAVNTTGRDRKAEIRIICGQTVITVTVEQRGTTEAGKPARLVSSITYEPQYCPADLYGYADPMTFNFGYDMFGRVVLLQIEVIENSGTRTLKSELDRGVQGRITVTDTEDNDWSETYTLTLDDCGRVATAQTEDYSGPHTYDFTYGDDDRLALVEWEAYGTPHRNVYAYADGVLSSITMYDGDYRVDSTKHIEEGFGSHANDLLNIDPNALFIAMDSYSTSDCFNGSNQTFPGRFDRCALLGLVGKRSDRLVVKNDLGDADGNASPAQPYMTPGIVVTESSDYVRTDLDPDLVYTFDDDGYILTITQTESVERVHAEWKVQVTNEPENPDDPSYGYRWYVIDDSRVETVTDTGVNRYVHTFQYQ